MRKGDSIKTLAAPGSPRRSPSRGPVCAALACGIPYYGTKPLVDFIEESHDGDPRHVPIAIRKHVWTFEGDAHCEFKPAFKAESVEFNELVRRFNSDEWCLANPHHPIAYMRAIFDKLNALDERLKTMKPLLKIQRGDSFALIPSDLTPEEQQHLLAELEGQLKPRSQS